MGLTLCWIDNQGREAEPIGGARRRNAGRLRCKLLCGKEAEAGTRAWRRCQAEGRGGQTPARTGG